MKSIKEGDILEVGVSEPADFFLDAGDGPHLARVLSAGGAIIDITFDVPLKYGRSTISKCTAKCRHDGDSFSGWDGRAAKIVNLAVNLPGLTHLIGGIRLKAEI